MVDRLAPSANLDAKRALYPAPKVLRNWSETPMRCTYRTDVGVWSHEIDFWGGDLASTAAKLDYVQQLGADVLYLNPIHLGYTNHKYDSLDYNAVSPDFGSRGDMKKLAAELKRRNLKLVLDGVFNRHFRCGVHGAAIVGHSADQPRRRKCARAMSPPTPIKGPVMKVCSARMALLSITALSASSAGSVFAQTVAQQKVTGPNARYWLSVETASGFSMGGMQGGGGGGMAAIMAAAMGGGGAGSARKSMRLELASVKSANPAEAVYQLAPALNMGPSLPLFGEKGPAAEPVERDIPETREMGEKPKGRMLFFWGCGERVGPGQPVVLDFAQMAGGVLPPNMRSVTIRAQRGSPSLGRDRGFAEWPNRKDSRAVPAQASLAGAHTVSGGFIPDIRFSVDSEHDFMDGLSLQQASSSEGGQKLNWNNVRTALGYFANGMGVKQGTNDANDLVLWNSSSVRLLGGEQLMEFLAPAETERLVRDKVVLPPASTECVVPKEVIAASGGPLMMVSLNAFGPELNVVHPPRPQDPKVDWNQEYAVKLRLSSYTGAVAGMGSSGGAESAQSETQPAASDKPTVKDQARSILKGIFGK